MGKIVRSTEPLVIAGCGRDCPYYVAKFHLRSWEWSARCVLLGSEIETPGAGFPGACPLENEEPPP